MAAGPFDVLVSKLMAKNPGWDRKRAAAVAASIGRKKYGAKGMATKSAAGRE